MTTMTTNTAEFDIDTLIWRACQTAGLMALEQGMDTSSEQWLARSSAGRAHLEMMIKALPAQGVLTRDVVSTDVTLIAGTNTYALAAGTTDVLGNGSYIPPSVTTEYPVMQIDREAWWALAQKDTSSRPTQMWIEKRATRTVYLYPTPNEAGTLRLQRKRILMDNSSGAATADLETSWMDWMMKELAYRLSVGMPMDERAALRADARDALTIAQNASKQTVPNRIELDHPTGWS